MALIEAFHTPTTTGGDTASVTVASGSLWQVVSGTLTLDFHGAGLSYSNGIVFGGLITGIEIYDSAAGGLCERVTGLSIGASDFTSKVIAGDFAGVSQLWLGANDTVVGSADANVLNGGPGADTMSGGAGDDVYYVDNAGDIVNETSPGSGGIDTVMLGSAPAGDYVLPDGVENAYSSTSFSGAHRIIGNALDNLIGGSPGDTLLGGAGNDTLSGFMTTVDGGDGVDTLNLLENAYGYNITRLQDGELVFQGGSEVDHVRNVEFVHFSDKTVAVADLLVTSDFGETVQGTGGVDSLLGRDGNDSLVAYAGNDFLDGGKGNDTLVGGAGDDAYNVDSPGDVVVEHAGEGYDVVSVNYSTPGTYVMADNVERVGVGTDVAVNIVGNAQDNYMVGGTGDDVISGGAGNDSIWGFVGNDTLIGGDGNDTFDDPFTFPGGWSGDGESNVMRGGAGDDVYYVATATDVVDESSPGSGGIDTIHYENEPQDLVVPDGVEVVWTPSIRGTLTANNSGDDLHVEQLGYYDTVTVVGGAGDDTVFVGGTTAATVDGGAGDDMVDFTYWGTLSQNLPGQRLADGSIAVGYVVVRNVESFRFADGVKSLAEVAGNTLTDSNDSYVGTAAPETISSGAGDDTVAGGAGADFIDGGDGNDRLFSAGIMQLAGSRTSALKYADAAPDTGTEHDTLSGGAGDDLFFAGAGDDVDGGTHASTLGDRLNISFAGSATGVQADLRALAHDGAVQVAGGTIRNIQAVDLLEGSHYDDLLAPLDGPDASAAAVRGLEGNDHIIVGNRTGLIDGGAGDDTIDSLATSGVQSIEGGDGNDKVTFAFSLTQAAITYDPSNGTLTVQGKTTPVTISMDGVESLGFTDAASLRPVAGTAGVDNVQFGGKMSDYIVSHSGNTFTVASKLDGTGEMLVNVERIHFGDYSIALDIDGNAGRAYRLYQAAFDRQPDLGGLGYQMHDLDAVYSIEQVASNFIASPEFQRTYGSVDNSQFITLLYNNVLHRAPDAGGFQFHLNEFAQGESRADMLIHFSESPENQANVIGQIGDGMVYVPPA